MQLILNGDTRPIPFFIASSGDHVTGLTGAAPAVTISKNGGAFAAPSGTVGEIGDGWYSFTPAGTDTGTDGMLILHAAATGGDPTDLKSQIVAFSPYDAVALGLSRLDTVVSSRMASFTLPANFSLLAIDSSGDVTANNPGPTLAQIKAGILDEALSAHTAAGTTGAALGTLISTLAESYAANGEPATLAQLLYGMLAILSNVSQAGTSLTAARLDGATPAMTFTLDSATAPTTRRRTA